MKVNQGPLVLSKWWLFRQAPICIIQVYRISFTWPLAVCESNPMDSSPMPRNSQLCDLRRWAFLWGPTLQSAGASETSIAFKVCKGTELRRCMKFGRIDNNVSLIFENIHTISDQFWGGSLHLNLRFTSKATWKKTRPKQQYGNDWMIGTWKKTQINSRQNGKAPVAESSNILQSSRRWWSPSVALTPRELSLQNNLQGPSALPPGTECDWNLKVWNGASRCCLSMRSKFH